MTVDRITFIISSLTSGGAERVMTTMANHWAAEGKSVTILTFAAQDVAPFYPLSTTVERVGMNLLQPSGSPIRALVNNAERLTTVRKAIVRSDPHVVVSFMDVTNITVLMATRGLDLPVIVAEHTDPGLKSLHPIWNRLRALFYRAASRVVVLSDSARAFFPPNIQANTQIIPNPVAVDPVTTPVPKAIPHQVVSMGRFGPEKGFDLLIDAFARIATRFPDWQLVIWGDGELRAELTDQIDRLGMGGHVLLPGRTTQPHTELRKACLYAMSSRREGFPMALAEAMACGLPAVAFDLSSGVRDILRNGIDGQLVPNGDVPALAESLASLMADDSIRAEMAVNAPDVLNRFGVARVMSIWNQLLVDVTTQL